MSPENKNVISAHCSSNVPFYRKHTTVGKITEIMFTQIYTKQLLKVDNRDADL